MKKYLFLIVFIFSTAGIFAQESTTTDETTTYYLIRHAEKQRHDKTDRNPHLTSKGLKRAAHWATVLSSANIEMVYSTDYNRTKETAEPTAKQNGLEIFLYNPRKMYDEGFQHNTKGKNVLVVGHSNTTPAFVNKILGEKKYKDIDDSNNSNLYVVTVTKEGVTSVVLKIDLTE